jgi:hypothetical protein
MTRAFQRILEFGKKTKHEGQALLDPTAAGGQPPSEVTRKRGAALLLESVLYVTTPSPPGPIVVANPLP